MEGQNPNEGLVGALSNSSSLHESAEFYNAVVSTANVDLMEVLQDFNWQAGGDASDLETRLKSEVQAIEASNVHAIIQSEEQANSIVEQLERAIMELDIIDEWLSHYTRHLDGMGQDVHQIEVKNKSMQIGSANQKRLLEEMEKIMAMIRVPGFVIEILRSEPLEDEASVLQCEDAINRLMQVTQTKFDDGIGDMTAIKEKMSLYDGYAHQFGMRLHSYLETYFATQAEVWHRESGRISKKGDLRICGHESVELDLYKFRKLLRWLKGLDVRKHVDLQMSYVQEMGRVYQKETSDLIEQLRARMNRKVPTEDQQYLFYVPNTASLSNTISSSATSAIKSIGISGSRGNLSILANEKNSKPEKRGLRDRHRRKGTKDSVDSGATEDEEDDGASQKDGRSLRRKSEAGDGKWSRGYASSSMASLDVGLEDRMTPDQALGHALSVIVPIIIREQNFMTDLFGLSKSFEESDSKSWQETLDRPRPASKDVKTSKRIHELVGRMFSEAKEFLSNMIEAAIKYDQTFSVGMMVRIEEHMKETDSAAYSLLFETLDAVHKKASSIFEKFVDEQLKGIEETKVNFKKRTGILPFIRTFPHFVDRMEGCLEDSDGPARQGVCRAYERIVQKIMETLNDVAREVAADSKLSNDDKEQLNIHIINVENMHHFYSEVRARKVVFMDPFVKQTKTLYDISLLSYGKAVIRKPLGKLFEFFEGIDELLENHITPEEISFRLQYNKSALKDVLKRYPGKEIRKGLESLYKRVEKHFPSENGLLQVAWRGIQEEFTRQLRKYEDTMARCYPDSGLKIEFTMDELLGYFSDLARAH
ncbi:exocyst complex component Sec3-domain-containing protein [Polychytrium aggregatum]|uniref:exocyst complex component Sec3-domain-containing protein n=1 Tax=Polychytrium aggregatum TaxID=110093 RepID=UPI0022FE2EE9|nr:exocyst complex component Sec3-domain-containing protein [Polychytrium aggregatum]KAI9205813.1 exocyst complex component Sec3-domain-containing protein [Polychytrium aggregatum]